MDITKDIAEKLSKDWDIAIPETISEQDIINILAHRISAIMDKNPESLFQLMYRLDISETAFNAAVNSTEPALNIAILVYQRQKAKVESRNKYNMPRKDDDSSLTW